MHRRLTATALAVLATAGCHTESHNAAGATPPAPTLASSGLGSTNLGATASTPAKQPQDTVRGSVNSVTASVTSLDPAPARTFTGAEATQLAQDVNGSRVWVGPLDSCPPWAIVVQLTFHTSLGDQSFSDECQRVDPGSHVTDGVPSLELSTALDHDVTPIATALRLTPPNVGKPEPGKATLLVSADDEGDSETLVTVLHPRDGTPSLVLQAQQLAVTIPAGPYTVSAGRCAPVTGVAAAGRTSRVHVACDRPWQPALPSPHGELGRAAVAGGKGS
jgi:hypothetical protein